MNNIEKKKSISQTTIKIIICTIFVKFFGAARDLALSYFLGTTNVSDVYILATTIPVTVFAFAYEGISASYIPACANIGDEKNIKKFTNTLLLILTGLSIAVITIVEIYPLSLAKIFAPGLCHEDYDMASIFIRFGILGIFFTSFTCVITAFLNYHEKFIFPVLRSIPMDIVTVISYIFYSKTGNVAVLYWGIPISLILELLFLLLPSIKSGYRFSINFLFDENLKNLVIWSIPVIVSVAISDINSIIDRQFASIITGGISALTYSSRTYNVFSAIFLAPLATVLFPKLSKSGITDSKKRSLIIASYKSLLLISVPLAAGVMIFSRNIISILFYRGAFDYNALLMTSDALSYYSFGLIGTAVATLTTKVFYSQKNTLTPTIISVISLGVNFVLNVALHKKYGLCGLALASTISIILNCVLQSIKLNKTFRIKKCRVLLFLTKIFISTFIMSLVLVIIKEPMNIINQQLVYMISCAIIGVVVYFVSIFILLKNDLKKILHEFQ